MPNNVVGNIKSLTSGVDDLTKKINELHAAITGVGKESSSVFSSVKGIISGGGQRGLGFGSVKNVLMSSLSGFSTPTATTGGVASMSPGVAGGMMMGAIGGVATGAAQVAMARFSAAYGATMDTSGIINRAGAYYQSALRVPGLSRSSLERATFSALQGGMTGVGSDAQVASILSNSGYLPGSKDYLATVQQVRGAATYLGMNNANAAQAIAGLQSGMTGAQLYQYGISTIDAKGNSLSVGSIAQQMYSRLVKPGATAAQIQGSAKSGFLNAALAGMGVNTPDQQQMVTQAFIDIASGKNPDLASAKSAVGNNNPFAPGYQMNTSQTGIQQKSEAAAVQGLQTAADTVTAFNKAMGDTIASLEGYKAYLDGLSGTNAGRGIKAGAKGLTGGLKKIAGGLLLGAGILGEVGTLGLSTPISAGLMAGGAGLLTSGGGGTPGYGASFGGRGARGGGTPGGNLISAPYGATDSSGIWASTGNKHKGTDYNVALGTPVLATMDGIVSGQVLSADYGNAVQIEHANGFSTVYAHLSNKEATPGKTVKRGQEIGRSGQSGNTTGPSLHYEVRYGANNPVSPDSLIGAGSPVAVSGSGVISSMAYPSINGPHGKATNTNTGSKASQAWATSFLKAIGAPTSSNNITSLTTWMAHEGGLNHFNPLNTTLDMPGASLWNPQGVKTYTSTAQSIQATIETLTGKSANARGYTQILNDLKGNASTASTLTDISNSAWVTGKTGQGSYNGFRGGGTPGYGASVPTATSAYSVHNASAPITDGSRNTVNIYLTVSQASDAEAVQFAKKVKSILDSQKTISMIGSA